MMLKQSYLFVLLACLTGKLHAQTLVVPLGGNSWLRSAATNGSESLTEDGWRKWSAAEAVWSCYFYLDRPGELKISADLQVPEGESKLEWSINSEAKVFTCSGSSFQLHPVGQWSVVHPGYIRVDVRGLEKTGSLFANVRSIHIEGSAVSDKAAFVKNNEGNYFYWGRRGPSVHLRYELPDTAEPITRFYCEIRVPDGNDIIGSYFMADGFTDGYFGMQVNSSTERRVLFSVWSPFNTDDPRKIPEDQKIKLLEKGDSVYTGEFGNEGSGGQSYLRYNWKTGQAYGFLLEGLPIDAEHTRYTAWFYAPEEKKWLLIASFSRPATHRYLSNLYSFLENFEPETGYIRRKAFYQNQWVKTLSGKWMPVEKAQFTYDNTARKRFRLDYAGGVEGGSFFLENDGFFSPEIKYGTWLNRGAVPGSIGDGKEPEGKGARVKGQGARGKGER